MRYKYLFISVLILFILSINVVVASDVNSTADLDNEVLKYDDNVEEILVDNLDHNESGLDTSQNSQFESASDDYFECYVGSNENDGDGSPENPFSTLMLARNKIAETNTKNAIINIYDGKYEVPRNNPNQGTPFTFGTDNLIINGIGKNVSFVPFRTDVTCSFVLTTTSANFTMNNIIFNSAAGTTKAITGDNKFFKPVSGNVNAKITNCTFLGNQYTQLPRCIDFNTSYIGCIFKDFTSDYLIYSVISESSNFIYFENCVFSNLNITRISSGVDKNKVNVTFNGIWIGQNSLPTYTVQSGNNYAFGTFDIFTYGKQNDMDIIYSLPVKYAIFSVSENYLGNDQYEIVGRLTWNGTDSSEGIENFPPLTVILTSTTGEIQPTATLVNGTFKVNYTSSSFEHNVTAKLDSEEINLPFITKVKDYIFNISEITDVKVGDTKEITITLPDNADGQIVISVGDSNNFTETVNGNTTKVNITGFSHGENIINVIYSGNERYEPNTKIIKVSALKETTLTTTNITTTYNVAKDLVVTLVANGDVLANKTVNVVVGTINKNLTTNASGQVNIDVSTLAPNTYVANIAFAGDDLYIKSNTTANVVINKVASSLSAPKVT